jgi:protein gp37
MGKKSGVSWTTASWGPWMGCNKVSEGCRHCYAEREMSRYGKDFSTVKRTSPATFFAPLKWKLPARSMVFVCPWSDFFHPEADVWRNEAWAIMLQRQDLIFQICTKRPERVADHLPLHWDNGWKNVWMGVTVENSDNLKRWDVLADIPAVIHFVSWEPALGPLPNFLDCEGHDYPMPDWIIGGGESGSGARPANKRWFIDAAAYCYALNIPYFFKQNGGTRRIDGIFGGDEIEGKKYHEFPEVK